MWQIVASGRNLYATVDSTVAKDWRHMRGNWELSRSTGSRLCATAETMLGMLRHTPALHAGRGVVRGTRSCWATSRARTTSAAWR